MQESDLYAPLKSYLEALGYEVKGEVRNCDIVATRGDEDPLIIELKLNLNLDVILQATDRLAMSPTVYVGIPDTNKTVKRRRKSIMKLFRMLGIGLIRVNPDLGAGAVNVVVEPAPYQPLISKVKRTRLLKEFHTRVGDPITGGTAMRGAMMTAYRQRALAIARYLHTAGPTRAATVAAEVNDSKARELMYRNVYGWFERCGKGVYQLTEAGRNAIIDPPHS